MCLPSDGKAEFFIEQFPENKNGWRITLVYAVMRKLEISSRPVGTNLIVESFDGSELKFGSEGTKTSKN